MVPPARHQDIGFISINASLVTTFTNNLLKCGFRMALQKNMFGSAAQRDRAKSLFDSPAEYFRSLQRSVMNSVLRFAACGRSGWESRSRFVSRPSCVFSS